MNTKSKFCIDFFEFIFLLESCIPPTPIARALFWERSIDELYHVLTENEKEKAFKWITQNHRFDQSNEDCRLFYARYNPLNQYQVKCFYDGKAQVVDCFKWNDKYHVSKTKSVNEEYISEVIRKR